MDKTCKMKSETEKVIITIEFYMFKIVLVPSFSLNWQFWILDQINPKRVFLIYKRKQWKSPSNSTIWIFESNFKKKILSAQNRKSEHFWTLHIPISLNKIQIKVWILGPNLPKKFIPSQKQKKWSAFKFRIFQLVWD